jgi:NADPH:quinone reductase-like Zn-dependent oxidoreductase
VQGLITPWHLIEPDIRGGKGPVSSLFISNKIEKPVPETAQALVRVKYFGVNRMDLSQRAGQYQVPPQSGPILGVEFSGIIEGLGENDADDNNDDYGSFNIGDEVFGLTYGGKLLLS